jgi:hypothetical protein
MLLDLDVDRLTLCCCCCCCGAADDDAAKAAAADVEAVGECTLILTALRFAAATLALAAAEEEAEASRRLLGRLFPFS